MGARRKATLKVKKNKKKVVVSPLKKKSIPNRLKANGLLEVNQNKSFPIVGIGASAGGLAAFKAFFSGIPKDQDMNMAFVLVQHLSPDHHSILAEIIRRFTNMQVFEVKDGIKVRKNCVYIIPPNYGMAFYKGALQLLHLHKPRSLNMPIDFLFKSLAVDQKHKAIGIVLSGTGCDGTMGIRAIKGESGMVMAQSIDSTEFDGMPRSAINTGLVDYELKPEEMPRQLLAYTLHAFGRPPRLDGQEVKNEDQNNLNKILAMLRSHNGHDFFQYKQNTIYRRIERRMSIHQISNLENYVRYLQHHKKEMDYLYSDLLINVTSFFRDPEAYKVIENKVLPAILKSKFETNEPIRIWSVGCSTGEEAYSIAILIKECMQTRNQNNHVQIFATDIDNNAINSARAGVYPASISTDVSPERLSKYFSQEKKIILSVFEKRFETW